MTTHVSTQQWTAAQAKEQDYWNAYADAYSRYPQILLEHLRNLRDVGEYIRSALCAQSIERALEVGVGPLGIGILGMQKSNFCITAVDSLPPITLNLPDGPLRSYVQALREGVTYRTAQGENLPFEDESFDFVCCHNVIDHSRNPMQILEEIHRVLKIRCPLFLTLNTFSSIGRLKFEIMRRFNPDKVIFICHPHTFQHAEILDALQRFGYKTLQHDGGGSSIFGRSRLSKFLCIKSP